MDAMMSRSFVWRRHASVQEWIVHMNFRTLTIASALVLGHGAAALAMTPQEDAAFRQFCTGDYMRLCAQHDPSSPQVEQCFRTNMKDLSPNCASTITAYNKANPGKRGR